MATNTTLFLSVDFLRDNTVINGNVDAELLEPFILLAQNVHIEKVVGSALYNDLITNIAALSNDYVTLLEDYLQPALVQWSLYESLPFINYKLTNKAISTKNSDNSDPVELDELHYLRTTVRDVAEYMSERATLFLKANTDIYPLFVEYGTECDDIKPTDTNYFSGIVFD
ncbi:MAG: hypothetical protein KUG81_04225 [Gammaproteobacteria bacterium]|nr:hypothetical protein [Gammaproteobacteria bacterium]